MLVSQYYQLVMTIDFRQFLGVVSVNSFNAFWKSISYTSQPGAIESAQNLRSTALTFLTSS